MWVTLCAALATGSLPDLVAIVGNPGKDDAEIIARDLDTYRDYWLHRGLAASKVLVAKWKSPAESAAFAAKLRASMTKTAAGRLAIFVSGHGVPIQESDKTWIPAMSFENGSATYSWKALFAELAIPAEWRALVVPDT